MEYEAGIECMDIKRNVAVETRSPASDGSFRPTFTSEVRGVLPAKLTSTLTLFVPVFHDKSCNLGRWEKNYVVCFEVRDVCHSDAAPERVLSSVHDAICY